MQKHFRTRIGNLERLAKGREVYAEALNPYFGYFYTVKQLLASQTTKFQSIVLLDTDELGKVLVLDNVTQVADRGERHYHEPMVHPAFCSHPKPENVLVIGGGDGGVIREAVKYPCVKRIEVAELDAEVIEFSKKFLPGIHGGAFRDRRVRVNIVDGRRYVEEHQGEFDVVIMDMTDPSGPSSLLYTKEFFAAVKRSFRSTRGVFAMHTESPVSRPPAFSCIQRTLRASFKNVMPLYLYVQMYATLWSISVCSQTVDSSRLTAAMVDRRLRRYGIRGLDIYSGATHVALQTPFPYIARLLRKRGRIITDANPEFPDDFLS